MPPYRRAGEVPRKRHSRFLNPTGGLYHEELMGSEGFSSASSLVYHLHPPTAIIGAASVDGADCRLDANRPLLPRHFRTHSLEPAGDLVRDRRLLLGNDDVSILAAAAGPGASDLYRNAVGDELLYVEAGALDLDSMFGTLPLAGGDYAVVPTGTTHRLVAREPTRILVVGARGHIGAPNRYLSAHGQFLEHAPYCERDLRAPHDPQITDEGETPVFVRHQSGVTRYVYAHHPFDVIGWDGCLYPYALSIHDFEPIVKRFHAPPPVHQTFAGPNFVVCSFCPRPLDFDPEAVPVPYNHANVDSDEVIFYAGGRFTSRARAGIGIGSISLHPAGLTHGPHPGSAEAAAGATTTDELAVMVDTFAPLGIGPAARDIEDPDYAWSWSSG